MSQRLANILCVASFLCGPVLAGVGGCRREQPGQPEPTNRSEEPREAERSAPPRQAILLLLDAARPDRFSCYGYQRATTPEMDRLAAEGVVFRKHYAQATYTRASVSSLMCSRYYCLPLFPSSTNVPYAAPSMLFRRPDQAQISFTKALKAAGFKTAAVSAHIWTGRETAFAAEFDEMHDLTTRSGNHPYPDAGQVIDRCMSWIGAHKEQDYFLYIHLMDPHYPHNFGADAQAFFGASSYETRSFRPGGGMAVPESDLTDDDRRYANALYDGSMLYADRQIGRLAAFLRSEKLIENTVIIVTADHGEHLFDLPGGRLRPGKSVFSHGGAWLDPVARIPLIIRYPRKLAPGVFEHLSEGVDVPSTLLALLDVDLPAGKEFDGIDLAGVISGQIPPKNHVLKPRGIRTDEYKCLFTVSDELLLGKNPLDPKELKGELYDLVADPDETNDLFQFRPEVVAEMLALYRESLGTKFERFDAARTSQQPDSAFAISAKHLATDEPLPKASGRKLPDGWSRLKNGDDNFIVGSNTGEPLPVHFRLPNGRYQLSVQARGGQVVIEVGGRSHEVTGGATMVTLGGINVTDEVFRATLQHKGNRPTAVSFFGFVPPGVSNQDSDAAKRQRERLRALGYVD